MEPIEDRWLRDPGIGQGRPQTGTSVGECGYFSVGFPYFVEFARDRSSFSLNRFCVRLDARGF
jgi:hypothetical protein